MFLQRHTHNLLLAAAVLLLVLRFLYLGDVPFINDEPALQLLLEKHAAEGSVPSYGLYGSQPIPYGPSALWLYAALRIISTNSIFLFAAFAFLQTLALVFLYFAIRSFFSAKSAAWSVLLAASSPYLFFYSRLLWDNNLLVLLSAALLWLLSKWWGDYQEGAWRFSSVEWLFFGLLSGLALNTHLMAGFILLGLWGFAFYLLRSMKAGASQILKLFGVAVAALVLISLPYLAAIYKLWPQISSSDFQRNALPAMDFVTTLFRSTWYMGYESYFEYFYRGSLEEFYTFAGGLRWLCDFHVSWVLRMAVLFILLRPFFSPKQFSAQPLRIWLSVFWILHCLGEFLAGTTGHPHYYISIWWLPFVVLAYLLTREGLMGRIIKLLTLGVVLLNLGVLFLGMSFIKQNQGTRGQGYGPTLENQEALVLELCTAMQREGRDWVAIDWSQTQVFSHSIQYLMMRRPECQGLGVGFAPGAPIVLDYADSPPGSAKLVLRRRQ